MTVTLSLVLVLAVVVWLLVRKSGLRIGHAIVAVLLGFYLEDTSLAPSISRNVMSVADMIGHIRF